MLCLMAMSDRRGYLEENRKPMLPAQLARRIGAKLAEVKRLLAMLEQAGVFSRDDKGVIYSRRMVDDERRTVEARRWGRQGGNPKLTGEGITSPLTPKDNPTLNPDNGTAGLNSEPRIQKPDPRRLDTHTARKGAPVIPTLEDVKAEAEGSGLPDREAGRFFHYWEARDWKDKAGKPLTKWQSVLRTWTPKGNALRSPAHNASAATTAPRQPSTWELKTQLDATEIELKRVGKGRPSQISDEQEHAKWQKTPQGQQYAKLRKRRDDLRAKLTGA